MNIGSFLFYPQIFSGKPERYSPLLYHPRTIVYMKRENYSKKRKTTTFQLFYVTVLLLFPFMHGIAQTDTLTLLFAGDLMQHQGQIDAARQTDGTYDYSECFAFVQKEISSADIAVGNLETTLGGAPYSGYPLFCAPDAYLSAIKKAGFDIMLTANNHCLDKGQKGLERTIRLLDSLQIYHTGTYRDSLERQRRCPLVIDRNGFRIVLLNYTYGTNGISPTPPNMVNYINRKQMEADIFEAKQCKPDLIIACMHWDTEYRSLPGESTKQLADWLFQKGVDYIIGGHPHVIQPIELHQENNTQEVSNQRLLAYSLGNFISNMSANNTDGGIMLKICLTKQDGQIHITDCGYTFVWTSRPALNGKKQYILYPSSHDRRLMNQNETIRMERYLKNSRELYRQHTKNINEYMIE